MLNFETMDDILDFAIVQEKAAQAFYAKLSNEAETDKMRQFYRVLEEEEQAHEKKLRKIKTRDFELSVPDLTQLKESGYLDALPLGPDMSFKDILLYGLKKERSAKMLYKVLADTMERPELAEVFKMLSEEESKHAEFFQKEYDEVNAKTETGL